MTTTAALVVDKAGLARKLAHKPKSFVLFELLQNALDEKVSNIEITATMIPGRPLCEITVTDDAPEGFQDLASVYTLFRDSKKAKDPEKRGRFEIGEKLVAALAKTLTVRTTKGTVHIEGNTRQTLREKAERGSCVRVTIAMTRDEFAEMEAQAKTFLPPQEGPYISYNGKEIRARDPVTAFEASLQTVIADDEGRLKTTRRKTDVLVYPVQEGETACLYEMGIPVVPTGDSYHYDVQQRVPVNWERNNVPPSYLKALRVEALNLLHDRLTEEEAAATWVQSSLGEAKPEALNTVLDKQFGKKRVVYDPSDREGTHIAVSKGYTVIPGNTFPKDTWDNIRDTQAALPAGQVTPSPKAYNENATKAERLIPKKDWSPGMHRIVRLSKTLAKKLLNRDLDVRIINEPVALHFAAVWTPSSYPALGFNAGRLGKKWFDRWNRDPKVLSLLLHEFGHNYSPNHLSSEYHDALCDLGARLTILALNEPEIFEDV